MTVSVRPLEQADLGPADRIFRLAFGTFLGLPDPSTFRGDVDLVNTRWTADASATLGAFIDGELVGSNFAANWGSFGFFGPLTVRPDLWDRGVATRLVEATMKRFEAWGTRHTALFTFPHSPKHIGLYQKFGFWPQFLTALMSKASEAPDVAGDWSSCSGMSQDDQRVWIARGSELTGSIFPGLDLSREIQAVNTQGLGETIFLRDDDTLIGLAVCHMGKGTEAGDGATYVKFAAVRPGAGAPERFDRLLSVCE